MMMVIFEMIMEMMVYIKGDGDRDDDDNDDKVLLTTVNLRAVTYFPTIPGRIKLVNNKKGEIVAISALGIPYS